MMRQSAPLTPHLRALRWRITGLFILTSTLALAAVAVLAVTTDSRVRRDQVSADLRRRGQVAASLLYYDKGSLRFDALADDAVTSDGGADLVVYERTGDGVKPVFATPGGRDGPDLAKQVLADADDRGVFAERQDADGGTVLAFAYPFYNDDEPDKIAGAVLVTAGLNQVQASWRQRSTLVIAGAGGSAVLAAVVGWLLAGLAVRPAAAALERQERFIASAAHELRTPASRVSALAQRAQLSAQELRRTLPHAVGETGGRPRLEPRIVGPYEELMADLRRAVIVSDRAGRTVTNLLAAARIDAGRFAPRRERVRLDRLLASLEDQYQSVVAQVDQPVEVRADPGLLALALDNLVLNAEQHAGRAGSLPLIEVRCFAGGKTACFEVSDDGPGIGEDAMEHLFERHRSGAGSSGSGLGLWLVRWVAEQHGGAVDVWTTAAGTTFRVTLSEK
jgi:two-component system OmpR family sensor kinase